MFVSVSFSVSARTQLHHTAAHPALPDPTAKLWFVISLQKASCTFTALYECFVFTIIFLYVSAFLSSQLRTFLGLILCIFTSDKRNLALLKLLNVFHYTYWSISREGGAKSEMSKCISTTWPKEQVITVTLYQSSPQPKQGM